MAQIFSLAEARRGFQVVGDGRHFVIFCNHDPINMLPSQQARAGAFESPCEKPPESGL